MRDFMIIAAEGVFRVPEGGNAPVAYPDGGDPIGVLDSLEAMVGREVIISVHYFPPDPPEPTLPGYGACLMGSHCPAGHVKDPTWMLDFRAAGTLRSEGFAWFVGDDRIPLGLLPGHRARFVMTTSDAELEGLEGSSMDDQDVGNLVNEVSELEALLKGLRTAVKGAR
jgi:hypothetical protein